jgi:hypothetical protein
MEQKKFAERVGCLLLLYPYIFTNYLSRVGQCSPGISTQRSLRKRCFLREYWLGRKRYYFSASRLWSVIWRVIVALFPRMTYFYRWYSCFEGGYIRRRLDQPLTLYRLRWQRFTVAEFFLCQYQLS